MVNHDERHCIHSIKAFYLLTFFALGSLMPLLSVYLKEVVHLNGYQIGTIMSVGPIVMIFFQPLWGILSDKTNSPLKILAITTLLAAIFSLGYLQFQVYQWLLLVAILVAIFQSAIIPISDSISIEYANKTRINYGSIRLFGSLGFGLGVFLMGRLSEVNQNVIFYAFFLALTVSAFLSFKLPNEETTGNKRILSGLKEVFTYKKFNLFLVITFLIFGPNLANNTYFGLFVENRGGTYTGIGIAFLMAVLSEIPFMRVAGDWIRKLGLMPIAMIAGTVALVRWFFYYTEPNLMIIYVSSVLQGVSIGLFIPAGLQYIREITPTHITVTAITIYSAIGNGLGNWFSTFVGGIIYERYHISAVYLFFSGLTFIGVVLNLYLVKLEKKDHLEKELLVRN